MARLRLRAALPFTFASVLFAQSPANPEFEVASIKPVAGTGAAPISAPTCSGTRFSSTEPTSYLIQWAYAITPFQLSGLPAWASSRAGIFSIEAKSAAPAREEQCRLMLRALLADRFKLTVHQEPKRLSFYALTVGKNGPKMKPVDDSDPADGVHINGAKTYGAPKGWSMAQLAEFFQRSFPSGPPIIDKTGLAGLYRFTVDYAFGPYDMPGVPPRGDGPDIFGAVDAQLGLKLERRTEPVDTTVIDHVEQPEAN